MLKNNPSLTDQVYNAIVDEICDGRVERERTSFKRVWLSAMESLDSRSSRPWLG